MGMATLPQANDTYTKKTVLYKKWKNDLAEMLKVSIRELEWGDIIYVHTYMEQSTFLNIQDYTATELHIYYHNDYKYFSNYCSRHTQY